MFDVVFFYDELILNYGLGKFDLPCMVPFIYKMKGDKVDVLKKGTRLILLEVDNVQFKDVLQFIAPCSLSKFLKMWNVTEAKVRSHFVNIVLTMRSLCFRMNTFNHLMSSDDVNNSHFMKHSFQH